MKTKREVLAEMRKLMGKDAAAILKEADQLLMQGASQARAKKALEAVISKHGKAVLKLLSRNHLN
jgi:hypothetical protein